MLVRLLLAISNCSPGSMPAQPTELKLLVLELQSPILPQMARQVVKAFRLSPSFFSPSVNLLIIFEILNNARKINKSNPFLSVKPNYYFWEGDSIIAERKRNVSKGKLHECIGRVRHEKVLGRIDLAGVKNAVLIFLLIYFYKLRYLCVLSPLWQ